jgi:quercetin dioxygenase-like cupin family protein
MKRKLLAATALAVLLPSIGTHAQQGAAPGAQEITRAGAQASAGGPSEFFTGRVRIDPLWPVSAGITASGSYVTFEPGAHSAWHTHPAGQRLVVVSESQR